MSLSGDEIRELYEQTEIVRRPTYGIVSGYHELPYICLGTSFETRHGTTEVRGKIHVSPRFVIRPRHLLPKYREIFEEEDLDLDLAGRMFGFMGFPDKPVECRSEELRLRHLDAPVDDVLSESLDELARYEDITTGVILSPNTRYYPISIERFIASILDDEFRM